VSARRRCPECRTPGDFPDTISAEKLSLYCAICHEHRCHLNDFDFHARCPICIGRFWLARLRALRVLVLGGPVLRVDDL
jgi:hypothetical protein